MLPGGGRARDILWRLPPGRPKTQEGPGRRDWPAVLALPLLSHAVHDFPEQDCYWDLEVSGWEQKGGWLDLPRGF